jgi:hypothetical protein
MHGLLDRSCNPRPAYQALRCLNTILFAAPEPRHPGEGATLLSARALEAHSAAHSDWLLLPDVAVPAPAITQPVAGALISYGLPSGTTRPLGVAAHAPISEPTLLRLPAGTTLSWAP